MAEMMISLAIALVRLAFRGHASAADIVTDHLDGTVADADWRGAWRSAMAIAPYSRAPIGMVWRLFGGEVQS